MIFFFDGLDSRSGRYSRVKHIAQMIRLLGPPPLQLLERADQDICSELFSGHGIMSATSISRAMTKC